ncbi:MAG: hypothetical protein Q8R92_01055 [Deltaproteobacteria bacterium]|nr:hypothetical protein [Deltaproteobacteria bacterium]
MNGEQIVAELQERLKPAHRNQGRDGYMDNIPIVECGNGLTMSVQTGPSHYCQPRDGFGPWFEVEVGFPSAKVDEFMPFIDGKDSDPTDTVYGFVPINLVAEVIAKNGGMKP